MRTLLLLRGAPGSGKTTWIEKNGLKQYALSADDIRLQCQSPALQVDGTEGISQSNDNLVWKTLFEILECRLQHGEFTVNDATNSKSEEMNRYKKLCESYRYRIYCVDFTDVPIEVAKERNRNREALKQVPDEVIDKMYSRFATQNIPSGIKRINPDELETIWMKPIDLSEYKAIHHIGDIHGCNTVLQEYFDRNGGLKDDEFYFFLGDYIDRGIENADVIKFLLTIKDKKNVSLLEGNHERWLWNWANNEVSRSREFEFNTRPQLETAKISKKDVRQLYRKLIQCAYYTYHGDTYLVTHGGISTLPENLTFVATEQMIKGVGAYKDASAVADTFCRTTPENCYQIHGHRNISQLPIQVNDRVYNLDARIEYGGQLRCVQVRPDGITPVEITNNVFKPRDEESAPDVPESGSLAETILKMRENKYIKEKSFGNISVFNFTRDAFQKKEWNEQTMKARGLFIDIPDCKVVARAYDKFFNINERPETRFDNLQDQLKFPVTAYVKENGFLGIVSYDKYADNLLIASKSSLDGVFTGYLGEMLIKKVSAENRHRMMLYAKEHDVSFLFECVDTENDPHVIEYPESELFLLDIVYNQIDFKKYSYKEMCAVADELGLKHKEKACEIANWPDFCDWYYKVLEKDYTYNGRIIEGFVIEDSMGFMTKLKLTYYNFWKFMRSVANATIKSGHFNKTSALTTPTANLFYGWIKNLCEITENKEKIPKDICTLRKMFYEGGQI